MKHLGKIWVFYDVKTKKQSKPLNVVQAQALVLNILGKKNVQVYLWTPGWSEWVDLKSYIETEQPYFVLPPSIRKKSVPEKTQVTKTMTMARTQSSYNDSDEATAIINSTVTSAEPIDEKTVAIDYTPPRTNKDFTKIADDTQSKKVDYGYFHPDFRIDQLDPKITKLEKKNTISFAKKPDVPVTETVSSVSDEMRTSMRFNFKLEVLLISKSGKSFKSESENISLGGIKLKEKIPKEFIYQDFSVVIINNLEKDPKKARVHFNTKIVGDIKDPSRLVFLNPDDKNKKLLEGLINTYIKQAQKEIRSA